MAGRAISSRHVLDLTGGPVPAGIDCLEGVFGVDADAGGGYVCGSLPWL